MDSVRFQQMYHVTDGIGAETPFTTQGLRRFLRQHVVVLGDVGRGQLVPVVQPLG